LAKEPAAVVVVSVVHFHTQVVVSFPMEQAVDRAVVLAELAK
jgi:hypothetical protein